MIVALARVVAVLAPDVGLLAAALLMAQHVLAPLVLATAAQTGVTGGSVVVGVLDVKLHVMLVARDVVAERAVEAVRNHVTAIVAHVAARRLEQPVQTVALDALELEDRLAVLAARAYLSCAVGWPLRGATAPLAVDVDQVVERWA